MLPLRYGQFVLLAEWSERHMEGRPCEASPKWASDLIGSKTTEDPQDPTREVPEAELKPWG